MDLMSSDYALSSSDDEPEPNIYSRRSLSLGLTKSYARNWTTRDAFREYCQNWKDAIIESYNLLPENFVTEIETSEAEYIARIFHPSSKGTYSSPGEGRRQLLGFVRYVKKNGVVELANFHSRLNREMIYVGSTSKEHKENQAGTHGEGFKVASLVMARNGYHVRYATSEEYWNLRFGGKDKEMLLCNFNKMSERELNRRKTAARSRKIKHGDLSANIWEDVSVKIGKIPNSKGCEITASEFQKWLKVSIDLDHPSQVIKTDHGNLILDPRFSGKVFLKGLLLEDDPVRYKYGYNLMQGLVDRDRRRLMSPRQEAKLLSEIWGEAIQKEDILDRYIQLLRDNHTWADVNLAKENISETTARAIWKYLLDNDPKAEIFYHDHEHGDSDIELITKSLRKRPVQLTGSIWCPLRRHKVGIRTPEEQRNYLLESAAVATIKETPYSASVQRVLNGALALDTRTRDLELVFKVGAKAELDLLLHGSNLLIHEKWLDFHASHDRKPCWLSHHVSAQQIQIDELACDHIVTDLYDLLLIELTERVGVETSSGSKLHSALRLKVQESFRAMPRMIRAIPGGAPGEIEVSWLDTESTITFRYGFNIIYLVTLHRQNTCSHRRSDVLKLDDSSEDAIQSSAIHHAQGVAECGCPYQLVSQNDHRALFCNLNTEDEYFPMVARADGDNFFGCPPNELRPTSSAISTGSFDRLHAQLNAGSKQPRASYGATFPVPALQPSLDSSDDEYTEFNSLINPLSSQESHTPSLDALSKDESMIDMGSSIQYGHQAPVPLAGAVRNNRLSEQFIEFQGELQEAFEKLKGTCEKSNAIVSQLSDNDVSLKLLQAEIQQLKDATRADAVALDAAREIETHMSKQLSQYVNEVLQLRAENEQLKEINTEMTQIKRGLATELAEARDRISRVTEILQTNVLGNDRREATAGDSMSNTRANLTPEAPREKRAREGLGDTISPTSVAKKAKTAEIVTSFESKIVTDVEAPG